MANYITSSVLSRKRKQKHYRYGSTSHQKTRAYVFWCKLNHCSANVRERNIMPTAAIPIRQNCSCVFHPNCSTRRAREFSAHRPKAQRNISEAKLISSWRCSASLRPMAIAGHTRYSIQISYNYIYMTLFHVYTSYPPQQINHHHITTK
jgi:hypothetical protein